jgi:hypothetical protein
MRTKNGASSETRRQSSTSHRCWNIRDSTRRALQKGDGMIRSEVPIKTAANISPYPNALD